MLNVPIIDTHLHLCNKERFNYTWLGGVPALDRSYLLKDYNEATRGLNIAGLVFMEYITESWEQSIDEARWVSQLAKTDQRIKGIIARAPLHMGEKCRPYLDKLKELSLVKGIRQILQFEKEFDFCLRPEFIKGTKILPEYNWFFHICIKHEYMPYVLEMVEKCPEVNFILDHIGKPDIKNKITEPWKKNIKKLAGFKNTICKISGMITEADSKEWTKEDLKPYIDEIIECFGFDRLLFGGDWPVCNLAGTYKDWILALEWALKDYSREEISKLMHDNAKRIYNLK